jgi:serine phosphatase RsbU (regulator of sigma subunit)
MLLVFVQVNRVLYAPVQEKVDGLFYRNKYEYRTVVREFVDKLSSVISSEELFPSIVNTVVNRVHIRTASIMVFDNKSGEYYFKYSRGISDANRKYKKEDEFFSFLEHRPWRDVIEREQLLVDPQYNELKDTALQRFSELSAEVCLVLKMEEKLVGIVTFGPRMSGEAYKVDDIKLFQYIAGEVSTSIYNALHHDDLVEKQVMDKELSLGHDIQLGLLPEKPPNTAGLDVYGHMQPARMIGGDYYDFLPQGNDDLGIVIGDVSGKGAPAGLIMVMAKTIVQSFCDTAQFSTKEILLKVNKILERNTHANMFMTMNYMHWSGKDRMLRYTGAGQEYIIIYRKHNQNCEVFKAGGVGLGILPNEKIEPEIEEKNIRMASGDGIVLFTDGATEAINNQGEMYGLDRLVAAVKRHGEMEARELLESLYSDIKDFRGAQPLYDDITMIVMKAKYLK